ncbi:MAG: DUF819 family protein [Flavobacteriales bacterium]
MPADSTIAADSLSVLQKTTDVAATDALITNDAVIFGILCSVLALVFYLSSRPTPLLKKFFNIVPGLLLCYFIPGLLNSFHIISGADSGLYSMAKNYLLPASLVLFTLSIDFKALLRLGPKALLVFLAGSLGVIVGGPVALFLTMQLAPDAFTGTGADEAWRGFSTIAGSWIGGGANQTAMKEVFQPSSRLFSVMIAVDVFAANIWMAFLLYGAGRSVRIDRWLRADARQIDEVRSRAALFRSQSLRIPGTTDLMLIAGAAFGAVALSHFLADSIAPLLAENYPQLKQYSLTSSFFWIVLLATTLGLLFSFTPLRNLEGAGASNIGSVLLYILVATIGMQMDVLAVFDSPVFFLTGLIWITIHGLFTILAARLLKAPFFFAAVGSQANIGGAASAPVVAAAFDPALASVGVLLSVLGYALGTYGGYIAGLLMQWVSAL